MSLQIRMALFLVILLVDAALIHDPLPAMAVGVGAYLLLIYPMLGSKRSPSNPKDLEH